MLASYYSILHYKDDGGPLHLVVVVESEKNTVECNACLRITIKRAAAM